MNEKTKIGFWVILSIIALAIIGIAVRAYVLESNRYFSPKEENVKRQVFEQTKSYVHGVIQDLGKYYDEYKNCDEEKKQVITSVIKMRFAEFDAENIKSLQLKNWFIEIRGF